MKKHLYHVEIWGDYQQFGTAPTAIRKSLESALRHGGHDAINFTIGVSRVVEDVKKPTSSLDAIDAALDSEEKNERGKRVPSKLLQKEPRKNKKIKEKIPRGKQSGATIKRKQKGKKQKTK